MAKKKQSITPLVDALSGYREEGPLPLHMPGHKQGKGMVPALRNLLGARFFTFDVTEVEGLDDLHAPSGAIREAQKLAAELFGAGRTFFLVNGVLAGFFAMLTAAGRPGETVLVARNLHPAAAEAIVLSRIVPTYWQPDIDPATLLPREPEAAAIEAGLRRYPNTRAVLLPGPSIGGALPDWAALAAVCHRHGAALLADETAGISFPGRGALPAGADAAVQSPAPVPGAPAQGALLHIGGRRLDPACVQAALGLIQTTSPSYLIMAGLDRTRRWLAQNGPAAARELMEQAEYLRRGIADGRENATVLPHGPGRDPFCLGVTFPGRIIADPAAGLANLPRTAQAAAGLNSVVLRLGPGNDDDERIAGVLRALTLRALAADMDFPREILPEFAASLPLPLRASTEKIPYRRALMRRAARRTVILPPDACVLYPGEVIGETVIEALAWQEQHGFREDKELEVYAD
ncbi:MAG: DegT/DnrJ/EryC1/StrS family aminotransferase [bacterium]